MEGSREERLNFEYLISVVLKQKSGGIVYVCNTNTHFVCAQNLSFQRLEEKLNFKLCSETQHYFNKWQAIKSIRSKH